MKLVVINGPPGVGKTTSARLVHEQVPRSALFCADAMRVGSVDRIERPGQPAIDLSQFAAAAALRSGKHVIVEGVYSEHAVLEQWEKLAADTGADMHEYMLWGGKAAVLDRIATRGYPADNSFTPDLANVWWHTMDTFRTERPAVVTISTDLLPPPAVAAAVLRAAGFDQTA